MTKLDEQINELHKENYLLRGMVEQRFTPYVPWKRKGKTFRSKKTIVNGRVLETPFENFEMECELLIVHEQENPSPDNALIGVLCNAVRLSREHVDMVKKNLEGEK